MLTFEPTKTQHMKLQLQTFIDIQATPKQVWSVFANFKAYPEWNPFITSVTGEVQKGKSIAARIDGKIMKPTILVREENHRLEWLGHLGIPGLFDGQHGYEVQDLGNGLTRFTQREQFSGILIRFFKRYLQNDVREGFDQMNRALKARVESGLN